MYLRFATITLCIGFACQTISHAQQKSAKPNITVAKYAQVEKAIEKHRGKVVVVEYWSTTWLPCLKNFPHLVKMHKKYKSKGLVVLTVSLDGADGMGSKEVNKAVGRVLQKFNATFPTFVLNESFEFIEKKLKFLGPPAVYVFDRQGKSTMFCNDEETQVVDTVIEKLVVNLLKTKK